MYDPNLSQSRVVIRPKDGGEVRTFMRDKSFHAANAAYLAVASKDDEAAAEWYGRACRAGITFA